MNKPNDTQEPHWVTWHRRYDVEGSSLGRRLAMVQHSVRNALDTAEPGRPFRILRLCAGRGHDVIDVVADHPRRDDVRARLVEFEPELTAHARAAARDAGLERLEVVTGDASISDAVVGIVPADLILLCGIFGNISDDDVRHCIETVPTLCAPGATVIWTRHRNPPDLTPTIRAWFTAAGFEELAFDTPDRGGLASVGAHRLTANPRPFQAGQRLFTFVGDGSGA